MARPWCDTPLVHISFMHYTTNIGEHEKTKEVQGTRILFWKGIWMFVCSSLRRWKSKFFNWSFSCGSMFCKSVVPKLSTMFCNWQCFQNWAWMMVCAKLGPVFCNQWCFQNWAWTMMLCEKLGVMLQEFGIELQCLTVCTYNFFTTTPTVPPAITNHSKHYNLETFIWK